VILAAAALVGIDTVYPLGGAQAIGALAYGTESIPQVDKIAGPGNLFVTLAKREVYGTVGIDGLYGPTETMVIADENANPAWVAADLLAQAEHDVLATAICLTPSRQLAEAIQVEVGRQIESLSRSEIIATALTSRGGIVLTQDLAEAAALADDFAVEHLCLDVANPGELANTIHSGGCFFLGGRSFEVLGDYVAGPSHSLPTGGTARFASPLNVFDFVRINSFVALDDDSSGTLCGPAALIADAEALTAHASAARMRITTPQAEETPHG
jgi:histidinol dehydrogenase